MSQSDRSLATAVVREHGPGLLGFLTTLLRDDDAAREAFSELCEELWRALPRFERRSSVKTFAYAIAYRCALRQRRRRARKRTRPLRDSEHSRLAASVRTAAPAFARTEAERRLDVLRASLTPAEQTLLVLRVDRRMAWDEIAEVLGASSRATPATMRKRFERLKARLRALAEREGLLVSGGAD